MAQMQLCGATKEFGAVRVIDKLDMTVEDGSLTVFVGPSGCGKSTLLRMIAGIEEISGGDLLINGQRMNGASPVERGVAMVFQNYALYPHLSVEKNVGFGLKMADMPRSEIRERVHDAARILKIQNLLKRKPSQLSGGQRQRVAIGRAIVRQPKLFLFDEPLSNLDAELRVAMRIEIAKLHRTLGTTMIYVTHDQTEAMTLASKIVVLRDGKVEQQGTPIDLFEDPYNMFVAGFIGSPQMNFLQARLSGDGGAPLVSLKAGPELSPGHLERMPAQGEVMLGIRPEHLSIYGRADVQIQVVVDVVENLGGRYFVYAMTESGEAVNFELRDHRPPDPEDRLTLGFAIRDMRLFEPSGPRLRTRPVN